MKYRKVHKYKYRLSGTEIFYTGILGYEVRHRYFILNIDGKLTVLDSYLWDGVSGPTWDSKNTMKPGLGHDALYHMIRLRLLPPYLKDTIDLYFKRLLLDAGVWPIRAGYYYKAVKMFGGLSCKPGDIRTEKVFIA